MAVYKRVASKRTARTPAAPAIAVEVRERHDEQTLETFIATSERILQLAREELSSLRARKAVAS